MPKRDVFVCHASEDKDDIATPLANALKEYQLKVWYDDFILTAGDDLKRKIDEGLNESRYGIVILSPKFFEKLSGKFFERIIRKFFEKLSNKFSKKCWLNHELDALLNKKKNEKKVILPVLHKLTPEEVKAYSSVLANIYALSSSDGIPKLAEDLIRVIDDGVYLDKPDTISIAESLRTKNSLEMSSPRAEERDDYWEITVQFNAENNMLVHPTLKVVFYTFVSVSPAKRTYRSEKKKDENKMKSLGDKFKIVGVAEESYGYIWKGNDRGNIWINGIVVFRQNNLMVRIEYLIPDVQGQSPVDKAEQYAKYVDSRIVSKIEEKIQEKHE